LNQLKSLIPSHVKLIAVSKTHPFNLIKDIYDGGGQKYFGENYVQELIEKANLLPSEINWHFIGHLQSNKVNQLIQKVPNLVEIETIDSIKLANTVNNACRKLRNTRKLNVLIEIATSEERTKSGLPVNDLEGIQKIVEHITNHCEFLNLRGFMTIADETCPDLCFEKLRSLRDSNFPELETLSMGMSGDWEIGIKHGSTQIRLGSAIFGHRDRKETIDSKI
jgi:PLP dependent protein